MNKIYLFLFFFLCCVTAWGTDGDTFTATYKGVTLTYTILSETEKVCETGTQTNIPSGTSITIPSQINGYRVVGIGYRSFRGTSLKSITIPASVISIGTEAFEGCSSLSSVSFSYGIENINWQSFKDCTSLVSITIPGSVKAIGGEAFRKCTKLSSAIIAEGVEVIESGVFSGCTVLSTITFPNTIVNISTDAVSDTPWFTNLPDGLVYIGKVMLVYKGDKTGLVTIKNGTVQIADYAFDGKSISSISLPTSLTSIGNFVFRGCNGLVSINMPNSLTTIGKGIFQNCKNLVSINIPNKITTLNDYSFSGCTAITSIELPNSVISIGNYVFENCKSLTSFTIPANVSIGKHFLSGCTGLSSVSIKSGVSTISESMFYNCTGLKVVVIPNTVVSIGDRAFFGCSNIETVSIPNSVRYLYEECFYGCSKLSSINIPTGVTKIPNMAFYGCSALKSITIPDGITEIGIRSFEYCTGLSEITIPGTVKKMETWDNCWAFSMCTGLNSITICKGVSQLGNSTFSGCSNVTNVTVLNEHPIVPRESFKTFAHNAVLYVPTGSKDLYANYEEWKDFKAIVELDDESANSYPLTIKAMGNGIASFNGNEIRENTSTFYINEGTDATITFTPDFGYRVKTVKVNNATVNVSNNQYTISKISVNTIIEVEFETIPITTYTLSVSATGNGAVVYNSNSVRSKTASFTLNEGTSATVSFSPDDYYGIKTVKVNNSDVTSSITDGSYTINNIYSNTTIDVVFEAIPQEFDVDGFLYRISGPNAVEITGCQNKTGNLIIPETVLYYGKTYHVTSIGNRAFYYCSGLTSVTIPNSVTSIGQSAFQGCSGLTSITIGNSVTSIGEWAISCCYSLTSVTIPNSVTSIGFAAFYECKGLTSVTIPNSVTSIGSNAFVLCSGLTSVTIPSSVTSIEDGAFSGCSGLTYIVVESGNTHYDSRNDCNAIIETASNTLLNGCNNTIIPNSVTSIEEYAFYNCSGLTSVAIPNSVTDIGGYAFEKCSGLISITIPNSVTSIGNYAFRDCSGMTSVNISNSVTSIGESAFYGCSSLKTVISEITNPFTVSSNCFSNASKATLIVPQETKSKYENLNGWKGFKEIKEEGANYSISITVSGNGSASYNNTTIKGETRSFTLEEGTSATVSFAPDDGYRINTVKVNNAIVAVTNNQYTINKISANTTVNVEFEAIPVTTHTLSVSATGNGAVVYNSNSVRSKTASFTLNEGTSASVTFSPDNGYRIASVKLNDKDVTANVANNQYTISNMTANAKLDVTFEAIPPTTYTLSITSSGNGSVSYDNTAVKNGSQSFTITEGASAKILFTPDDGYRIKSVKVNNAIVTVSGNLYTINNVSANTTVSVEFEAIPITTYTLSVTTTGNGAVVYNSNSVRSKTTSFTLNEGTSATISFSPDNGYRIASVKLNDKDVTANVANNQYTVSNMTANAKLDVTFEAIPPTTYTLSITSSGNGSVSYDNTAVKNGSQSFTITEGASAKILFTPDDGYRIKSVKVNNATVTVSNNQYTINNISANTTVNVEFEAIPVTTYTLSVSATGNGAVVYNSNSVRSKTASFTLNEGTSATVSFSPDNGYRIASVKLNDKDVTSAVANNQYTISNITANAKFDVTFEAIPPTTYTLSITSSGNGSVTYDKTAVRNNTHSFTINEGTSAAVSISPDNGYRIASVKLNGKDVTANVTDSQYSIGSITDDTNLSVTFEAIPIATYTLSIRSTGNGSASYDGTTIQGTASSFTVNEGTDATITFTPNEGYQIKNVKVDDAVVVVVNNQYTIRNITKDTSVEVIFEEIPQIKPEPATYTLTIKATGNGAAKYHDAEIRGKTTPFTIEEGTNATITFTADEGYRIKEVKVNGEDVTSSITDNTCAINNIGKDTSVEVVFEEIPQIVPEPTTYTLTIKATGNGSAYYGQETVKDGTGSFTVVEETSVTVVFSPEHGHRIKSVMVNGSAVSIDNNQYTINDIKGDMSVEVEFEAIPVTTYTLSVKASGNGSASFDGTTIKAETATFIVNEGSTAILSFSPDNGNSVSVVMLNGKDITDKAMNNRVVIDEIAQDITFEVVFKEDINALTVDGINYKVVSQSEKTVMVVGGDYGQVLTIPATVSQDGTTWKVTGIEKDALKDIAALCAVIWEPEAPFTADVSNPNLLLYVKDAQYAPADIKNVVVNGSAASITLVDANSGNSFFCPQAFSAQKISYTHHYGMITGIGESRGWETIALPFDVQTVTHAVKGACRPFANWKSGDDARPFWLYELTGSGFAEATGIEAYTPYVISMPNHEKYKDEFILSGNITFAATNAVIKKTEDVKTVTYGDRTFVPCFNDKTADLGLYALNVNNDWAKNNSGMTDGSRFVLNMRKIHPFEAYMVSTSNASRWYFDIFERVTTAIKEIEKDLFKDEQIYDLQGRKTQTPHKKGIYVTNGKKLIVR